MDSNPPGVPLMGHGAPRGVRFSASLSKAATGNAIIDNIFPSYFACKMRSIIKFYLRNSYMAVFESARRALNGARRTAGGALLRFAIESSHWQCNYRQYISQLFCVQNALNFALIMRAKCAQFCAYYACKMRSIIKFYLRNSYMAVFESARRALNGARRTAGGALLRFAIESSHWLLSSHIAGVDEVADVFGHVVVGFEVRHVAHVVEQHDFGVMRHHGLRDGDLDGQPRVVLAINEHAGYL